MDYYVAMTDSDGGPEALELVAERFPHFAVFQLMTKVLNATMHHVSLSCLIHCLMCADAHDIWSLQPGTEIHQQQKKICTQESVGGGKKQRSNYPLGVC